MQIDRIARITQQAGALERIGPVVAGRVPGGGAVLLVTDPVLAASGVAATAEASLRRAGFSVVPFDDVQPFPTTASADYSATMALWHKATAVVAIGGGAAMDVGKAAACIAAGDFCATEYAFGQRPLPAKPLAKICVPTGFGSGAEATRSAYLTDDDGGRIWLRGDALKPDEVVLDPALTTTLAGSLVRSMAAGILVQAIDAATSANANPLNDVFALEAVRLVGLHGRKPRQEPADDLAALQRAALLAGIASDNAGAGPCSAFAFAYGSLTAVPHGAAMARAARACLGRIAASGDDGRCARVAGALGGTDLSEAFVSYLSDSGVEDGPAEGVPVDDLVAAVMAPRWAGMLRSAPRELSDTDIRTIAAAMVGEA